MPYNFVQFSPLATHTRDVHCNTTLGVLADVTSIVIDGVSVLQNRQYSNDLADPSTQQYQSLEQEFCDEVSSYIATQKRGAQVLA